jgi:hypothetical protein
MCEEDDFEQEERVCEECGRSYRRVVHRMSHDPPLDAELDRYCLPCWLGVGPNDEGYPELVGERVCEIKPVARGDDDVDDN